MDDSLGFHAAMFFGSFDYVGTWLWDAQYVFYAGIGGLVMAVAGRLFLRDDRPGLRRFLRAVILVIAVPFALFCRWLAGILARRPPRGALRRGTRVFRLAEAGALAAFAWWASQAPIPPWLAWPLAAAVVAFPTWAVSARGSRANRGADSLLLRARRAENKIDPIRSPRYWSFQAFSGAEGFFIYVDISLPLPRRDA